MHAKSSISAPDAARCCARSLVTAVSSVPTGLYLVPRSKPTVPTNLNEPVSANSQVENMKPHLRSLPDNATLAHLRSQYGELLDLLRPYAERLMRGPSPFSPGEREMIAAYVSGVNSCRYCHGTHSLVALGFGIMFPGRPSLL